MNLIGWLYCITSATVEILFVHKVAAAYATNGPYLGARAEVPYWKVNVYPDEFSMNYILVGSTLDPNYKAFRGADPPAHLTNQIAVGLVVNPLI